MNSVHVLMIHLYVSCNYRDTQGSDVGQPNLCIASLSSMDRHGSPSVFNNEPRENWNYKALKTVSEMKSN